MTLSRTAHSLYWIGRHIERADFTARVMGAGLRFDMVPYGDGENGLKSAFEASGASVNYQGNKSKLSQSEILHFLAFDENNPSSIISCLAKARHDARNVRTAITREVFEELNETWINLPNRRKQALKNDYLGFIAWIEDAARGFDGALQRTMLRNEQFWFLRLGAAIERADNTARLLDVKYHFLLPKEEKVGGPLDQSQWTALLRSVSAETAYRWLYREGLSAQNVAEMLILRSEMPRSLLACVFEANLMLSRLREESEVSGIANRNARKLLQKLEQNNIENIFKSGLHEFLQEFLGDNNQLDAAISNQFTFV